MKIVNIIFELLNNNKNYTYNSIGYTIRLGGGKMMHYLLTELILIAIFFVCIKESNAVAPTPPIAIHQLIVVNSSASTLIRFKGFDTTNPKVRHTHIIF